VRRGFLALPLPLLFPASLSPPYNCRVELGACGERSQRCLTFRKQMKKLRKRAKAVGLEIRKVGSIFRLWNVRSGAWLDVKSKKRVKNILGWLKTKKRPVMGKDEREGR
jgi:hypothetical protein